MTDTVLRDLIAARALIDAPEKWTQCGLFEQNGCFCVMGATAKAITGNPRRVGGYRVEVTAMTLKKSLTGDWPHLAAFNDHPSTTHADIMALFDRAIEVRRKESSDDQ